MTCVDFRRYPIPGRKKSEDAKIHLFLVDSTQRMALSTNMVHLHSEEENTLLPADGLSWRNGHPVETLHILWLLKHITDRKKRKCGKPFICSSIRNGELGLVINIDDSAKLMAICLVPLEMWGVSSIPLNVKQSKKQLHDARVRAHVFVATSSPKSLFSYSFFARGLFLMTMTKIFYNLNLYINFHRQLVENTKETKSHFLKN